MTLGLLISNFKRGFSEMDDPNLQLLLDRYEISDMIIRFAMALDLQDWSLLRSCFTDEIEVNYFDFRGEPPSRKKAEDFVDERREALTGLKTQHISTNHMITVDGSTATCISCAVIYRFHPEKNEENTFNTHGYYQHTLIRTPRGWKICKIKQTVFWNAGNAEVHGFHRNKQLQNDVPGSG
jgi:hypothetical protein